MNNNLLIAFSLKIYATVCVCHILNYLYANIGVASQYKLFNLSIHGILI